MVVLLSVVFVATIVLTIVVVPLVIVRLPVDYFCCSGKPHKPLASISHPLLRPLAIIGKNLLGLVLVGLGIALLFLPGQGVIVILIGVLLLDFPGKRRVERFLISRGPILQLANWLRRKWHKEPLVLD